MEITAVIVISLEQTFHLCSLGTWRSRCKDRVRRVDLLGKIPVRESRGGQGGWKRFQTAVQV